MKTKNTLVGFPVLCDCGGHPLRERLPRGMTHPKTELCPHVSKDFQWEVESGTCCTTDLGEVAEALKRLGKPEFAAPLSSAMTAEDAIGFGRDLERLGEETMNASGDELDEAGMLKVLADCQIVLAAGAWYRHLSDDGFGVVPRRTRRLTAAAPAKAA